MIYVASLWERNHMSPRTAQAVSSTGQWNVTCVGSIRRKTHVALPRYTANSEHTIGAMEDMSRQGNTANTLALC